MHTSPVSVGDRASLLRAARQLMRRLHRLPQTHAYGLCEPVHQLQQRQMMLQRTWRMLGEAERRGWSLAAARLRQELLLDARHVRDRSAVLGGDAHAPESQDVPPTSGALLRTLIGELDQLNAEFEIVTFDLKAHVISVQTESIVLHDVTLGSFRLDLSVDRLTSRSDADAFNCIALDPNPAAANQEVTHPHVKSECLCAGDATLPIGLALRQGRVCDAFCLIRAVLNDYNPHSPYVSIDEWNGRRCDDCDGVTSADDLCHCDDCGRDVCADCCSACEVCDCSCCRGCLETDGVSDRRCCTGCRHICSSCGRTVDADRFVPDTELCPECHEEQLEDPDLNEETDHDPGQPSEGGIVIDTAP